MDDKQIFEMWETFKDLLKSTNREGIDNLIKWLDESDFKFARVKSRSIKRCGLGPLKKPPSRSLETSCAPSWL